MYSKTHVAAREHVCVAKAIYKGYRVFNEIVIEIQKIVSIVKLRVSIESKMMEIMKKKYSTLGDLKKQKILKKKNKKKWRICVCRFLPSIGTMFSYAYKM